MPLHCHDVCDAHAGERLGDARFEQGPTMFSDVNVDRFSTMSLASSGPCTIPSQNLAKKQSLRLGDAAGRATNRTDDIDGATPSWHAAKYANKPSFYGSKDIKGASPTKLHRQGLHPDNTLRVDDIEG